LSNPARAFNAEPVFLAYGTIRMKQNNLYVVATDRSTVKAKRSINCLVQPQPGDTVLISQDDDERAYILNILESEYNSPTELVFDGDVDIKTPNGRFGIAAQEGIDLVSAKDTTLLSSKFSVNAVQADVNIERISLFSSFLQARLARIKLIGQTCDSVFERISQRVKRCYRQVDDLDHLRAGQLNYVAKKLMSFRGKYTVMTAKEDVRIDADKILMG